MRMSDDVGRGRECEAAGQADVVGLGLVWRMERVGSKAAVRVRVTKYSFEYSNKYKLFTTFICTYLFVLQ